MALFSKENRIKCGRCNTEFDLQKNLQSCPLCGFGKHMFKEMTGDPSSTVGEIKIEDYLVPPPSMNFAPGKIVLDHETKVVGLWGMVNDFFSGKALLRINANMISERKKDYVSLFDLIEFSKKMMHRYNLTKLKGFPNDLNSESSVGRLVYHFIDGFYKMGLFEVKFTKKFDGGKIWKEDWRDILIRPTEEGLEFARLPNRVFDEKNYEEQTLTNKEREWIINYLKKIDNKGFKEYTLLKEIFLFLKKGNNGNVDLWNWFKSNDSFVSYLKVWSSKKENPKSFNKQIEKLAQTFSIGKISLLREMGVIKNKRNDYTIIGEL